MILSRYRETVKSDPFPVCYNRAAMAERPLPEKRIFTYEEAAGLLPEVRRITEEAYRDVEAVESTPPSEGGKRIDVQSKLETIARTWARSILELGLEVKGLWLVDFDNGSGYYCWRYPETGLQFFHSYQDGFRGRVRIH